MPPVAPPSASAAPVRRVVVKLGTGVLTSGAPKLPLIRPMTVLNSGFFGSPRDRNSSAIGWSPSFNRAPPRRNPTSDPRIVDGTAWITGADAKNQHVMNLVAGRDFERPIDPNAPKTATRGSGLYTHKDPIDRPPARFAGEPERNAGPRVRRRLQRAPGEIAPNGRRAVGAARKAARNSPDSRWKSPLASVPPEVIARAPNVGTSVTSACRSKTANAPPISFRTSS